MDKNLKSQFLSFNPILLPEGVPEPVVVDENGQPWIRIRADHASSVRMRVYTDEIDFTKEDGIWKAPFPIKDGITYVQLLIDEEEVVSPYLPITYGYSRPYNCVMLEEEEENDFYRLKDVPHGRLSRDYFRSSVTGQWESCMVYTPAQYDEEPDRRFPVLYLQHGHGEDETGWFASGKADMILDNLFADKEAEPFIVICNAGMVQKLREDGKPYVDYLLFPDLLVKDVIPYIENRYRIKADRKHRAMAGLSMGSVHTSITTFTHPELFSKIGVFSGFLHDILQGNELLDTMDRQPSENRHLKALDDKETFERDHDVFFRAMGDKDIFFEHFSEDDELLRQKDITCIRKIYSGGHDWNTWRRCLRDFARIVFARQGEQDH